MNSAQRHEKPVRSSIRPGRSSRALARRVRRAWRPQYRVARKVLLAWLVAWLPLLVLSAAEGTASGGVHLPLLRDPSAYARFLIALPLLIVAESFAWGRIRPVLRQFLSDDIVADDDRRRFRGYVVSALRLRGSILAHALIILAVYTVMQWLRRTYLDMGYSSWYAEPASSGAKLTPAGYWLALVSTPLLQFMLLRWYFLLFLWYRFMWQVSRLNLRLIPTHPDLAGGLGFLDFSARGLSPLILAQSVLVAGAVGVRMFQGHTSLLDAKLDMAGAIILLPLIVLVPLFFFGPRIIHAWRVGLLQYASLSTRYVSAFHRKWIDGQDHSEHLLGTSDIQSLADLSNSFTIITRMRPAPVYTRTISLLLALAAAPFVPLVATMVPVKDVAASLLKALL